MNYFQRLATIKYFVYFEKLSDYPDADRRKIYTISMCSNIHQSNINLERKCSLLNSLSVNQWCELWHKRVRVQVSGIKCTFRESAHPLSSLHKSVGKPIYPAAQATIPSSALSYPSLPLPPWAVHHNLLSSHSRFCCCRPQLEHFFLSLLQWLLKCFLFCTLAPVQSVFTAESDF